MQKTRIEWHHSEYVTMLDRFDQERNKGHRPMDALRIAQQSLPAARRRNIMSSKQADDAMGWFDSVRSGGRAAPSAPFVLPSPANDEIIVLDYQGNRIYKGALRAYIASNLVEMIAG